MTAASAIAPVGAPSGATTQKASESPDSPRTAPSGLPNGAGRSVTPALASQLPVKLGVTRPPIRRISMTMRPSAARMDVSALPVGRPRHGRQHQ